MSKNTAVSAYYLYGKRKVEKQRAARRLNHYRENAKETYNDIRFFLINIRLRILHLPKGPDVRTNMKFLLKKCGYRRKNATMIHFMETTLDALDLKVTDRHKLRCDLGKVKLEDVIIFQVKRHEPIIQTDWNQYDEIFHDGNSLFPDYLDHLLKNSG